MKKRAMKKYIPYGDYCYGRITEISSDEMGLKTTGMCKNLIKHKLINDFMVIPKEIGSRETKEVPVSYWVYKCRYTGVVTNEDAALYDGCKICGVKEPNLLK